MTPSWVKLLCALVLACALTPPAAAERESAASHASSPWTRAHLAELAEAVRSAPESGLPVLTRSLDRVLALTRDAMREIDVGERLSLIRERDQAADALFERLAQALGRGLVTPAEADPDWAIARAGLDLEEAHAAARALGVGKTLRALAPASVEYERLSEALRSVRAEPPDSLDAHGRSRESRLGALAASLERRRWLPRPLPADRIELRLPAYELALIQAGQETRRHALIIGRTDRATPSFEAQIEAVVANPYWDPPYSILYDELAPRFARTPAAAAAEGFIALDRTGAQVPIGSVDWRSRPLGVRIRQAPGPRNALGRIKFLMPNPFAIGLHDTPSRGLFAREIRTFSHGCLRLADPVSLANALLADQGLGPTQVEAVLTAGVERRLALSAPLPVFALYMTADLGPDGQVRYHTDVYGRDARLLRALAQAGAEEAPIGPEAASQAPDSASTVPPC